MDKQLMIDYEKEIDAPLTDSLTGLFTHGFFQMSLEREINRADRYGESFALALIDVDSFASYNKRYGHVKGDQVLKEIASIIMNNIRLADLAAKYSGDVFAVILTKSDNQSALVSMERIRHAVEMLSKETPTVSMGLVSFPHNAKNRESLLKKADEILLRAKLKGKNRIEFLDDEEKIIDHEKSRILVVDDDPKNLKLQEALLLSLDYDVIKASCGEDALSTIKRAEIDLVLLDIMMPGMDGYEVCRRLKEDEHTRLIPVVMLTALDDIESRVKGIEAGTDDFITKPPNKLELLTRIKSLINVKSLNKNLIDIENVLFSLANAVEAKDPYTQGHIQRVSNMTEALGKKMGLPKKETAALRLGGILHDIGKIVIPDKILKKTCPLTPDEWKVIKSHPDAGYKICLPLKENLGSALYAVQYHHEKLDGSGYPDGLKGDEIPIVARIMAVVDIYDAMFSDRPYHKAVPKEKALTVLREEAEYGKLDKEIVEQFIKMVE
ncbi:MAG: diguanylate cyclase [Spirochaetota bacterium]|nr:diguanylate cyclase [Spirochaetota bacterium]